MKTKEIIKNFIVTEILENTNGNGNGNGLKCNDSLLEEGILDSFGMMKLLTFIEDKFPVQLESDELMPEYFETIDSISCLIESKVK